MGDIDPMVDAFVAEGEQAIDSLPSHAGRINQLLSTHFPAQTLEAVHAAMRPAVEGAPALNKKVAELSSLAREEAAVASAQFRKIEMWLRLKSPAVSDGNNFGVDVQNYVVGELATMRAAMDGMMASGRDYHWARSEGLNKMHGDEKHSKVIDSSKEVKDGKEEVSKSEKESQVVTKPASKLDYTEYVVCVDVRQYHQVFAQLTDMRDNYLKAHVLFAKNMKRLADPRGEGEDGSRVHSMSMF